MTTEYYTTVTATEGFWNELISTTLFSNFPISFIGEEVGFTITSKNKPAIREMIDLSNKFPDELFDVIITTDNIRQNIIEYYHFQSGATFFLKSEPLYSFSISNEVNKFADQEIIDSFKTEIKDSLQRLNVFTPTYLGIPLHQNEEKPIVTNLQFEYGAGGMILSAIRSGLTYIEIGFRFFTDSQCSYPLFQKENNSNKNEKRWQII